MIVDEKNILWLDFFEFLTYNKKVKLIELFKKGNDIRKNFLNNSQVKEILSSEEFKKMALCLEDQFFNRRIEEYVGLGVECITFYDERYPYLLKEISTPPLCLYCKGNLQLLNSFGIAIVGSRKPSDYGIVTTKQFAKELAKNDVTIVSGMAVGIDTIAHKTTLEENGKTIAVLGGGFKHIYPAINNALAKKITENNLLVSEYNPNIAPLSFYFIARNRIIAGLSHGVLVTEAGEKSGSLKTAEFAIEFNREIFAIPGKISSPTSKGTNNLIKSLQGSIVLEPADVLRSFNINIDKNATTIKQLDMNAQMVLSHIQTEKKTFQELAELTNISASELNAMLLELEMDGIITKLSGNSYILS